MSETIAPSMFEGAYKSNLDYLERAGIFELVQDVIKEKNGDDGDDQWVREVSPFVGDPTVTLFMIKPQMVDGGKRAEHIRLEFDGFLLNIAGDFKSDDISVELPLDFKLSDSLKQEIRQELSNAFDNPMSTFTSTTDVDS